MKRFFSILILISFATFSYSCDISSLFKNDPQEESITPISNPENLSIESLTATSVNVTWTDTSNNEDGFHIERSIDGVSFSKYTSVGKNISSYAVFGLLSNQENYFRIKAYNSSTESDFSNTVHFTTLQQTSTALVANHNYGNLASFKIPKKSIESAKQNLHIAYGHTSHGSQLTDGMAGLRVFANEGALGTDYMNDLLSWNHTGSNNSLHLFEGDGYGGGELDLDAGNFPNWREKTKSFLDSNPTYNVVMWSWCGQLSYYTAEDLMVKYLVPMNQLEQDYPQVKFVYMTGHLDGSGLSGNLHLRNEEIRQFCLDNNKILYDFADIESYDPSGAYFGDKYATDGCNYDYNGLDRTTETGDPAEPVNGDKNWALEWQASHAEGSEWFNCTSAHSQPVNANMKAYAAWWLWARLAGWDGN